MSDTKKVDLKPQNYILFIVVFMGLVGLMDNYLNLVENVALPYILAEYKLTKVEFAFWQGIFGIFTFAVFFIAWISDAYGRKKGILILLLVMGIPAFLIPFLTIGSPLMFMILYALVITGTLSNLWEIPVTEESPPDKRAMYGGIATLLSLIPIYAFLAGPIAAGLGWRWTYGIMFFLMLGLLALWFKMEEPQRWIDAKEDRGHEFLKIKNALKTLNRKDVMYIVACSIVYGLWSIAFKMSSTWGGVFYQDVKGWTPERFDGILKIGGVLVMLGAVVSGVLMDKIGRKLTLIVGCAGAVTGYMILGATGSQVGFWMAYFFMPLVFVYIMIYYAEVFRTEIRGTAVGISATAARLSYVLGPLLAAAIIAADPTMSMLWYVSGIFMIFPILSLLIKPYETMGKTLEEIQLER
jgi:AAHS family cis,cis-muconate transporter-like MFS transporter